MNYEESLAYLQGRLRLGIKLGNERFEALLAAMGDPHRRLRAFHIAGTKGKGSTTAFTANVLQTAGYRVGQYLSPYVYDVRERIQINGELIPKDGFARWMTRLRPAAEALEATEHGPVTEFELKTAIAFCWFAEQAVDYAVIEVGLGGRLDATNVLPRPVATAITNIGMDHTELLGDTPALIAAEKAGIVKPGVPCVTAVPLGSEAHAVIARICRERQAPLQSLTNEGIRSETDGAAAIRTPLRTLPHLRLRLRGAFQHANAAVAAALLDAADPALLPRIADDVMRRGLETAYLPGRLEQIASQPTVLVDVGHNELAAQALADALITEFDAAQRRVILIVGLSRQHAAAPFLAPLAARLRPAALVATQPSFRPLEASEVAMAARQWDIPDVRLVSDSVAEAARTALVLAGPDDLVCLTGSFYTVGDLPPDAWRTLFDARGRP